MRDRAPLVEEFVQGHQHQPQQQQQQQQINGIRRSAGSFDSYSSLLQAVVAQVTEGIKSQRESGRVRARSRNLKTPSPNKQLQSTKLHKTVNRLMLDSSDEEYGISDEESKEEGSDDLDWEYSVGMFLFVCF